MLQNENLKEPSFRNKHSRAMRIWHWSTFIIISGSLITVLLAKTLFNVRDNVSIIEESLQKNGVSVSPDQAKILARVFNDRIWDWHIYFGYVLAGLFIFRIALEFFQVPEMKFSEKIKNAKKYLKQSENDKKEAKHYLVVKYLYTLFYIILGIMAFTGLFMVFSDDVPDLKAIRHTMKNIHSFGLYVILGYITLHLGGVLFAESSKKK